MSILYFINTDGAGHSKRAVTIARHLKIPCHFVTEKPQQLRSIFTDAVLKGLPHTIHFIPTLRTEDHGLKLATDVLHIPFAKDGLYLARNKAIIDICARYKVKFAVIDVCVEIAMLMRLCGIPYIYMAMHGERSDLAHTQAFKAADRLLGSYPEQLENRETPDWVKAKTIYVDGIANVEDFDETSTKKPQYFPENKFIILLIKPKGKSSLSVDYIKKFSEEIDDYYWYGIGFEREDSGKNYTVETFVDDSLPYIRSADIIVANTGNNSVLEAGYFDKPLITKPERRFFNEHEMKAKALSEKNLAITIQELPTHTSQWRSLLQQVKSLNSWNGMVKKYSTFSAAQAIEQRYQVIGNR